MENLKNLLIQKLKSEFGNSVESIIDFNRTLTIQIDRGKLIEVCTFLKEDPDLHFDMCKDVVGVDYYRPEYRYEVVYNLYSLKNNFRFLLKIRVSEEDMHVPSVVNIWPGANWPEREVYDFFGIIFDNHPDLRRIYMPEYFEYYPLRKEFPLMGIPGSLELPKK